MDSIQVSLRMADKPLPATWQFASWADIGLLQSWGDFLSTDSTGSMRDSVEFARQGINRWLEYRRKKLTADSLAEAKKRSQNQPKEEFVTLLVLKASAWINPLHPLAFAYLRRTWCGGLYLEFMTAHPLAQINISGIMRATFVCLEQLAEAAQAEWVWWESTDESHPKYEKVIGLKNLLAASQPRVRDVFVVPLPDLRQANLSTTTLP